jgi:hypothetical protein
VNFYAAGEPHGMRNPIDVIAKYAVFEFHRSQKMLEDALPSPPIPVFAQLTDPVRWKRKLRYLLRRFIEAVQRDFP